MEKKRVVDSKSTNGGARKVRCPRCRNLLIEPTDVPLYRCGNCNTVLQAKHYKEPPVHVGQSSTGACSDDTNPVKDEVPINGKDHPDSNFRRNEMDKSDDGKGKEVISSKQLQESTVMNTSGLEKSSLSGSDVVQDVNLGEPPQTEPPEGDLETDGHMYDAAKNNKGPPAHVCLSLTDTCSNGTGPVKDEVPINGRDHPDSNFKRNEIDKSDGEKGKEAPVSHEQIQENTVMDTSGLEKSSLSVSDVMQHVNLEREPSQMESTEGELGLDGHMYDAAKHYNGPPAHVCHSLTGTCSNGTSPVKDEVPINGGDHPDPNFKRVEIDKFDGEKGKAVQVSSEQLQESTVMDTSGLGKSSLSVSDVVQHVNLERESSQMEPTECELEMDDRMYDAAKHYKGPPGQVCHSLTGACSNGTTPVKDEVPINDRDHPDSNFKRNEIDKSNGEKRKEVAKPGEQLHESTVTNASGLGKRSLPASDVAQLVNLERKPPQIEPTEGELEVGDSMNKSSSILEASDFERKHIHSSIGRNNPERPENIPSGIEISSNGSKIDEWMTQANFESIHPIGQRTLPVSSTNEVESVKDELPQVNRHPNVDSEKSLLAVSGCEDQEYMKDVLSEKSLYIEVDISQSRGNPFPSHGSSPTEPINVSSMDKVSVDAVGKVDGGPKEVSVTQSMEAIEQREIISQHSCHHSPPGQHCEMENHGGEEASSSLNIVKGLSSGSPGLENARPNLEEGSIRRRLEPTALQETVLENPDSPCSSSLKQYDTKESGEKSSDQARERRSLQEGHDIEPLGSSASSPNEPSSRNPCHSFQRNSSILSADFSSMQNWIECQREKLLKSLSMLSDSKEDSERMEVLNKIDELRNLLESHAPSEDLNRIHNMGNGAHHSQSTISGPEHGYSKAPLSFPRRPSAFESSTFSDENQSPHRIQTPRNNRDGVPYSSHQFQPPTPHIHGNFKASCSHHSSGDVLQHNSQSRGFQRENLRRGEQDRNSRRYCRPILGAAHFLSCYKCLEVLQIPEDFNFLSSGHKQLCCGSCFKILGFFVSGGKQIVPWPSDARRASPSDGENSRSVSEIHSTEAENGHFVSRDSNANGRRRRSGDQPPLHSLMGYFSATDVLYQEKN